MASKLLSLLAIFCALQICLAAVARENAPVTDPKLKAQGYSCQNVKVGPMKDGEVNNNYDPKVCGSVSCGNGVFGYESCSPVGVPPGTKITPPDPTKPYPECCNYPKF